MFTDVSARPLRRVGFLLCGAALMGNLTGCVQRRMTIRSNPPGALVYVDDYEIGTTPVSTDYIYYGTRKVRLVKDGYETLTVLQPMRAPWYQWWGLDFFSENLWPGEIRDERTFNYQMQPAVAVPTEQLLGRAENLRNTSRSLAAPSVAPVIVPSDGALPPGVVPAGPPVMTEPLPPPQMTLPQPQSGAPPQSMAPPSGTMPSYEPPGGNYPNGAMPSYPQGSPAPYSMPPSSAPPGSLPPGSIPQSAPIYEPPGQSPGAPLPFQGPAAPPGWRPMSSSDSGVWR